MSEVYRDADYSNQPNVLTRASLSLSRHMAIATMVGAIAIALGLTLPWPSIALFTFTLGTSVFVMFAIAQGISKRHARHEMKLRDLIAAISDNDPAPVFATHNDGRVCYQNEAARMRFGDLAGGGLAGVFERFVVSPAAVLHRLQARANATGAARDEMNAGKDALRVSAHAIGGIACHWRLEPMPTSGLATSAAIPLPMLTVGRSGQVLFINPAMVEMMGRRDGRLEQIVVDLPLRNGEIHEIAAAGGSVRRRLAEVQGEAGRTDLYFLPVADSTEVGDWTVEDAFPVPMLKLARDGHILLANQMARDLLGHDTLQGRPLIDVVEGLGRPLHDWLS
ncbi:MAG: PAS domain-containing protein, partial [Deltaproteobacteria bacterium]